MSIKYVEFSGRTDLAHIVGRKRTSCSLQLYVRVQSDVWGVEICRMERLMIWCKVNLNDKDLYDPVARFFDWNDFFWIAYRNPLLKAAKLKIFIKHQTIRCLLCLACCARLLSSVMIPKHWRRRWDEGIRGRGYVPPCPGHWSLRSWSIYYVWNQWPHGHVNGRVHGPTT